MERLKVENDHIISKVGREAAAEELGCNISDIQIVNVTGGYSRNRRSLVGYENKWIFAKEVDCGLLPSDGAEELGWIRKDYECASALSKIVPELVPEWEKLVAGGRVLLMSSYRTEDGWSWSLPLTENEQQNYVRAVIDATKKLETIKFDQVVTDRLDFHPYFRDKLALDDGLTLILQNEEIRNQLEDKYTAMAQDKSLNKLQPAISRMQSLLKDEAALKSLSIRAASLIDQPNNCFGHCDVRSDNIAYNSSTGQVKFVDWNWASFTPIGFGPTEFLTDISRRGVNIMPWLDELNTDLLAALVGCYTKRCLRDPLASDNILRDVQAQSAAVVLDLYEKAVENLF